MCIRDRNKDINPEAQVKKVFGFLRQEEMESFLDEHARDVDYVRCV